MSEKKLVTILIPAYNEEGNIEQLFAKLAQEISKISSTLNYKFEILLVDDGSTDKTLIYAKKASQDIADFPTDIKIISFRRNRGKTESLKTGIKQAQGDIIITMDADLQDDPMYIKDFLNKLEDSPADFVVGNRVNKYSTNLARKASSWIANFTAKALIGSPIKDMNCGFKAFTRECANGITLKSDYHRYMPLLASIEGFKVIQLDIEQKNRFSGQSKYGKKGFGRFINSLLDMLSIYFVYRFRKEPFRLFGRVGLFTLFTGLIILVYLSIGWFFGRYIYGRPLFFLGILLSILGTNILGMGLLGEIMVMNGERR